jgi:NRPS condensation-like uncharacterized protein
MQSATRIPFDYLDKVCLAATSRPHGISSAPVWQLAIEGDFDVDLGLRTVQALARRYPILVSRAVSLEPGLSPSLACRLAYEVDPEPDWGALFQVAEVPEGDEAAFARLQQEAFDRFIDMEQEYPSRFLWVRRGGNRGVLMVQQHHGIADGRAFFDVFVDLARFYQQALDGSLPDDIAPAPKLPEAWVAEPSRWRRLRYGIPGFFMHLYNLIRYGRRPPDQLVCNQPGDYSGHNKVSHLYLGEDFQARARELRQRTGFSMNDLLSASLGLSLAEWSAALGFPVKHFNLLMPADVRPRGWSQVSFANHLSSFLVDFDLARVSDPLEVLASVHQQIRRQATRLAPVKKVLAEMFVARRMSLGRVRQAVFAAQHTILNLPFSNLITISPTENGGRFATTRWSGEDLRIMTPCAWLQGVNTTVIRYNRRLCFNFNHKASAIDTPLVEDLMGRFHRRADGLAGQALGQAAGSAGPRPGEEG